MQKGTNPKKRKRPVLRHEGLKIGDPIAVRFWRNGKEYWIEGYLVTEVEEYHPDKIATVSDAPNSRPVLRAKKDVLPIKQVKQVFRFEDVFGNSSRAGIAAA